MDNDGDKSCDITTASDEDGSRDDGSYRSTSNDTSDAHMLDDDQNSQSQTGDDDSRPATVSLGNSSKGPDDLNQDSITWVNGTNIINNGQKSCPSVKPGVKELMDYMLDLVEAVVPFPLPKDQRGTQSGDAKTGRKDSMDTNTSRIEESIEDDDDDDDDVIELDQDEIEVIEERLPIEVMVNVSPDPKHISVLCKRCTVCNSKKMKYQQLKGGAAQFFCSDECLEKSKMMAGKICPQCLKGMPIDSMIFRPKFGHITSALCSEECLYKYEEAKGPKSKCRSCLAPVDGNHLNTINGSTATTSDDSKRDGSKTYHWQTMDFCSSKCVEKVLRSVGEKCVNCKTQVTFNALGKYSVRFGDVVRQFCAVKCLEMYKRKLKSCVFCQKELIASQKVFSYFKDGPSSQLKAREFCNQLCLTNFKELQDKKSMTKALQEKQRESYEHRPLDTTDDEIQRIDADLHETDICCICSCFVIISSSDGTNSDADVDSDHQRIEVNGIQYFVCSSKCASAFRHLNNIKSLICDGCSKYNWPLASGTVLRYSGKIKVFCSRRCQSLYVLRIRKINNCSCCKVKKYIFDLVEEYNKSSGVSRLFCSVNCMQIMVVTDTIKSSNKNLAAFALCYVCQRKFPSLYYKKSPVDGTIHPFCSYTCVTQFQQNPSKFKSIQEKPPVNTPHVPMPASVALRRAAEAVASTIATSTIVTSTPVTSGSVTTTRWTPGQQTATASLPVASGIKNNTVAPPHVVLVTSNGGQFLRPAGQVVITAASSSASGSNQVTYSSGNRAVPTTVQLNKNLATNPGAPEIYLIRDVPKKMVNAMVQVRAARVTKSTMCRPILKDAGCQTNDDVIITYKTPTDNHDVHMRNNSKYDYMKTDSSQEQPIRKFMNGNHSSAPDTSSLDDEEMMSDDCLDEEECGIEVNGSNDGPGIRKPTPAVTIKRLRDLETNCHT